VDRQQRGDQSEAMISLRIFVIMENAKFSTVSVLT